MSLKPAKYSSDIFVKAEVKRFSKSHSLEEFDSQHHHPPTPLSSKIGEYMVRISNSNEFCFNIIIQLLTHGKVRVDFRDSTERLQLVNKQDIMSRLEAVMVFDHWLVENRARPEPLESTRKLVLETLKSTFPLTS